MRKIRQMKFSKLKLNKNRLVSAWNMKNKSRNKSIKKRKAETKA